MWTLAICYNIALSDTVVDTTRCCNPWLTSTGVPCRRREGLDAANDLRTLGTPTTLNLLERTLAHLLRRKDDKVKS